MTPGARRGDDADLDGVLDGDSVGELADLRRRAYGPDADIATDAVAQARLRELEDALRERTRGIDGGGVVEPVVPVTVRPPTSVAADIPPRPPLPVFASSPTGALPRGASRPAPTGAAAWSRRLRSWSRSPRAIAIAGVAVLVVLALAIVPGLLADRPDASLRVDPAHEGDVVSGANASYMRQLGVDPDDLVRYEDFAGMAVWATPEDVPTRCIYVVDAALNCVPRGLVPVADVFLYSGMGSYADLDQLYPGIGQGSAVRFELRGDTIEVRVALSESDPSDAEDDAS